MNLKTHLTVWTTAAVSARLKEATATSLGLPPAKTLGYYNTWPTIVRQSWEMLGLEDNPPSRVDPHPMAIDRMLETMRWMLWLEESERHLLWMHAKGLPRDHIAKQCQISRSTLWRRWQATLQKLANHLNAQESEVAR